MSLYFKNWSYLIAFLCLFCIVSLSFGQSTYGSIEGIVVDNHNNPLISADILLPALERGASTNREGKFQIKQIPAGTFKVVARYIGYQSITQDITVVGGKSSQMQFFLHQSVLESEPIVVTGSPIASDPLSSPQDINYISGREKIRLQSTSLGKTIESIPGIYNMSAGSVAGKPIIRGQTGERIRILNDGVAQEYQQYGERHAPNLDPFNAERVEIIKGAASLLYGSDALGGAVNLIPNRFHMSSGNEADFNGSFTSAWNSNNNELMTGIKFGASSGNLGLTGSLVRKSAGNFHTPDIATFLETGKNGDPKFTDEIDNTDFDQINGSLAAGLLTRAGLFSVHYDHYFNENNFLLPAGTPIGLRLENQTIFTKGNMPMGRFIFKPKLSFQRNHRQAAKAGQSRDVLPDSAVVDLVLDVYTARFDVEHIDISRFSGTVGVEAKYYDHENNGKVPLQPTGHFTNIAMFGFEEWQAEELTLNFGARFDHRSQKFIASSSNPLLPVDDEKTFSSFSGALGASYKLSTMLTLAANLGRGFRTPSFYNMYVYGYHGGVFAYQIGNPDLKNETSLDMSASLRLRSRRVEASATVFQNRINNYIFLYNAPNHELAPGGETFVFAHDQADAVLTGFDISISATVLDWLVLSANGSTIRSDFASGPHDGNELPLMPADRVCTQARFLLPGTSVFHSPYILFNLKHVGDKDAAGIYEPFGQFDDGIGPNIPFGVASTKAYTVLNAGFGFDLNISKRFINIDLEITNLLDNDYRDFLDTYKGYTLAPGRSVNLKCNVALNSN